MARHISSERVYDERIPVPGGFVHVKCRFRNDDSLPPNFRAIVNEHASQLIDPTGEQALKQILAINFEDVILEIVKFHAGSLPTDVHRELRLKPLAQS